MNGQFRLYPAARPLSSNLICPTQFNMAEGHPDGPGWDYTTWADGMKMSDDQRTVLDAFHGTSLRPVSQTVLTRE